MEIYKVGKGPVRTSKRKWNDVICTKKRSESVNEKRGIICYNLKLELRLHLGKGLREVKRFYRSGKA